MPLAIQAILPLVVVLVAAVVVQLRRRNRQNGWIAAGATLGAAIIALVELLRLAPGEHVDVPYLTTFPYADLMIRLDGLSLGFVTVTLMTAAFLMLVRQWDAGDRRDPWISWLLSAAAISALMLAGNLLLLYILLQVLTLTWSGALDETARRRRRLRLTLQVADVGLLLAAASAIQSVGTSSFSGVPSDTFGVATFWLMMLSVLVRIGAFASGARRPQAAVAFGPAIAWLAPAAYIVMRLLALLGGRLPDRPTAVTLFVLAMAAAIGFALAALALREQWMSSMLLGAQACVALALSSGSEPLLTIAAAWMWLTLIPLAALVSMRVSQLPLAELLLRFQLSMLPGTLAFTGIWLGFLTLDALGLLEGAIPIAIAIVMCTTVAIRRLPRARQSLHPITLGSVALLLVAALPIVVLNPIVFPVATAVRLVPAGTASAGPFGIASALGSWPALLVCILVVIGLVAADRFLRPRVDRIAARATDMARWSVTRYRSHYRLKLAWSPAQLSGTWSGAVLWAAFAVVAFVALIRP